MKVSLIASPYDLGREDEGMGNGPIRYLKAGADRSLSERGFEVEVETIERRRPFEGEINAVSELNASLAERVRGVTEHGDFPLVLGGNCDTAIGVVAGLNPLAIGVIWFDAHGDFGTPETTASGYLGSMPLSTITGHCHDRLRSRAGNSTPVPEQHVVMVGVRDAEPDQIRRLENSAVRVIGVEGIDRANAHALSGALEQLRSRVEEVYVHLDIDSLDPEYAPGVDFPAPGGLSVEDVEEAILMVTQRFSVKAAALTAYNPERDKDDRTLRTGTRLIGALAEAAAGSREAKHGR